MSKESYAVYGEDGDIEDIVFFGDPKHTQTLRCVAPEQLAELEEERNALLARVHDLYEAVEDAVNYHVCCEEYPAGECEPIIDRVAKTMGEHSDWFYDDARPWMTA